MPTSVAPPTDGEPPVDPPEEQVSSGNENVFHLTKIRFIISFILHACLLEWPSNINTCQYIQVFIAIHERYNNSFQLSAHLSFFCQQKKICATSLTRSTSLIFFS
jgi:hypothetical protein